MSLLYWFDEEIIYLLEKFCHKFQLWTGKTNFFLVRVMIVVFIGSNLIDSLISFFKEKSWSILSVNLFFVVFYLFILLPAYVKLVDFAESIIIRKTIDGYKNQFKINPVLRSTRIIIFWFIFVFFNLLNLLDLILSMVPGNIHWYRLTAFIGITSISYLLACDPLPPCRSSIKEFFSSFFAKPVPVSSRN